MAKPPKKLETLIEVFKRTVKIVGEECPKVPITIFCGTLLGYYREKSIIDGDDDVDFYAPREAYKKIHDINWAKYKARISIESTDVFLQIHFNDLNAFADIYFYKVQGTKYIEEFWNALVGFQIPYDYFFPLQESVLHDTKISIPNKPKECLIYLYGPLFEQKLRKSTDYKWKSVNRILQVSYRSGLEKQ